MRHSLGAAFTAAAIFLAATPAARADAIPPPDEVTPAQSRMIGTWQQTEQLKLRDHGQGRLTLIFDAKHYVKAGLHVIGITGSSASEVESGDWTGSERAGGVYAVTLTPTGGTAQTLSVTFTGDKTMQMQMWPDSTTAGLFQRVFP